MCYMHVSLRTHKCTHICVCFPLTKYRYLSSSRIIYSLKSDYTVKHFLLTMVKVDHDALKSLVLLAN